VAGSVGQCLILNVPGSPKGAVESIEAVIDVLPHALELLTGGRPH
jgi:molybdopterin biosynthesis enzyme MoaB